MKYLILVLMFICTLTFGQQMVRTATVDIQWNAVVDTETITYDVIVAPRSDPTDITVQGNTAGLIFSVVFSIEGEFIIGVRTVKYIASVNETLLSIINWSDANGVYTPDPFVVRYFTVPSIPENLRLQ